DLTVFLEPMMVRYEEGKYTVDTSAEAMIRICGVASGLGKSSWKTWLKLPYSVEYPRIVGATTCPILMLGGPATGNPQALVDQFAAGMKAGGNVRGALVGRNVLYPGEADPAEVARAVSEVVHTS
ncbi:deoxyribose-phosphate aldolase, partial [bacterium]|nr:deoxyribose-phosphate aldolase [bacterium]